jgi:hypothetical protein
LAARDDVPAKGFDAPDVENGFAELEKGFGEDPSGVPPKSAAPIFGCGVAVSFGESEAAVEA